MTPSTAKAPTCAATGCSTYLAPGAVPGSFCGRHRPRDAAGMSSALELDPSRVPAPTPRAYHNGREVQRSERERREIRYCQECEERAVHVSRGPNAVLCAPCEDRLRRSGSLARVVRAEEDPILERVRRLVRMGKSVPASDVEDLLARIGEDRVYTEGKRMLCRWRREHRASVRSMARAISHRSTANLRRWLSGASRPSPRARRDLQRAFGVPAEAWLWPNEA